MKQQVTALSSEVISSLISKLKSIDTFLNMEVKNITRKIKMFAPVNSRKSEAFFVEEFANELYYLCCRYACVDRYHLALKELITSNESPLMQSFLHSYPQIAFFLNAHLDMLSQIYFDYFCVPTLARSASQRSPDKVSSFAKKQKTWPQVQHHVAQEFNLQTCITDCLQTLNNFLELNNANLDKDIQESLSSLFIFTQDIALSNEPQEYHLRKALVQVNDIITTLYMALQEKPDDLIQKIHLELSDLHRNLSYEYEMSQMDHDSLMRLYQ